MRIVLSLALTALILCGPATRAAPQDDPPSLSDMEADYMVLTSEADALGRGQTIQRSIGYSTDRQSTLRVQIEETRRLLDGRAESIQDLAAARQRFADGDQVSVFEDLAGEAGEEVAQNIAEVGMSAAAKRSLFAIGILLDVAEAGAERYVRYANSSDALRLLQEGAIQHRQIADMIALMETELRAEIRAQRRLEEILPEQRRLFDAIAERRRAERTAAASNANAPVCANTYKNHREAGLPLVCRCTGPTEYLMTWGTDVYDNGSTICNAAIHAGAVPPNGVGAVRLTPVARAAPAVGSTRNGISTNDYHREIVDGFRIASASQ